ncbi:hypothetical protein [Streptomyces olivochromogenes]|uniref:Uncharacterized protein n=1 Tax=Streptomyces olivochromogenes TaxID=1963 RepID=A0A250V3E3_STROL|nr:hypothetical protein [Streptomyces olivochromogenes]KUN48996.1 hypothetical protein AQJ27_04975 [Streptomyces olivochromogenes]GAX48717.1 hypothetical protein SO3561_00197 [Streptomyces olivochromogenes]
MTVLHFSPALIGRDDHPQGDRTSPEPIVAPFDAEHLPRVLQRGRFFPADACFGLVCGIRLDSPHPSTY